MSTHRHIAYGGARGGGKSWALRRKFVLLALRYPGLKLLLLRRTLTELRENHVIPLLAELNNVATYKETEKVFIFPNGSRLKLGYCDNEKDVYQYQGQEYDVIGLEEATNFTEAMVTFISTCNRSTRKDFKPRMYYTANPGGVGFMWFKRLFIDRDFMNSEKPEDYDFIPARVYDNLVLMKANPEYVKVLENLPEELRRAHLDGDWDSLAGQYFSEFRRDIHVVEPFVIPKEWDRYSTMDYGLDMLANYWIAVDPQYNVYIYRELCESDLVISEAAEKILAEEEPGEQVMYRYAPGDLWNRRQETGRSATDIFADNGLYLYKADNKRVQGWYNIKEWLRVIMTRDEFTGEAIKTSKLKIFSNCTDLIRFFPQMLRDKSNPNDGAKNPHNITHSLDSIRYFFSMHVYPASTSKPKEQHEIDDEEEEREKRILENSFYS